METADKGADNIEIVQGTRGHGMGIFLCHRLLGELMKHPGQTVYINFELPKATKKTIEKYATIKKVDAEPAR